MNIFGEVNVFFKKTFCVNSCVSPYLLVVHDVALLLVGGLVVLFAVRLVLGVALLVVLGLVGSLVNGLALGLVSGVALLKYEKNTSFLPQKNKY